MPWFAHHQAGLYWLAAAAGFGAILGGPHSGQHKGSTRGLVLAGLAVVVGLYLTSRPFLPQIPNDWSAYSWSLASLLPLIVLSVRRSDQNARADDNEKDGALVGYSSGLLVAVAVSVVYLAASRIQIYRESRALELHAQFLNVAAWSVISHILVAVAFLSGFNLIRIISCRNKRPLLVKRRLAGISIAIGLGIVINRFLSSAMSFDGWGATVYAVALSVTLTLWGFSILPPFHRGQSDAAGDLTFAQRVAFRGAIFLLIVLALASRSLIGGEDWNGFFTSTWVIVFWIAMSLCVDKLRPARASYSAATVLGVLIASIITYKVLRSTEIFWSRPLGSTDDEIALKLEEYSGHDASFQLAHHVLGNGRNEKCGDLCRILREYTNIRDTRISQGVALVENIVPTKAERPNVFIFVIDSMRADYLGAYNPAVDYTPHLDALARNSVTFHHAYTHYAGTSLSEPAIWAGAELLHAHFPQPFDEVNSLLKLARTDGYELVVSNDTVLRQLFSASDEVTKLDMDKQVWNRFEACSTVSQLESHLDERQNNSQPVFFFAQPMNVHQFAQNDTQSAGWRTWPERPGMVRRITYEVHWVDSCLGGFVDYLKQHGQYDNSIIVVASDHGDATGEFGRTSHSIEIWPEIMRVPLIIHLPPAMQSQMVYDDKRLSTLTDIAPTLYYLLGHRPIRQNALYGRPLFAKTQQELDSYPRKDLMLASDVRAVYGILTADGRYLYATYDSPAQSYLFDLTADPNAQHSILTPTLKRRYDEQIIGHLQVIGDYYGYKPRVGDLLASTSP